MKFARSCRRCLRGIRALLKTRAKRQPLLKLGVVRVLEIDYPSPMQAYSVARGCLGLALALIPAMTWANDTAISSDPGRVRLLKNRSVSMLSEHITLRYEGRCVNKRQMEGKWLIHASYRFQNLTKQPQRVRLGFPESLCDPQFGDCAGDDPSFQDMITRVRGKVTPHKIVELKATEKRNLGRIWAYWVNLKAGETVEVLHTFSVVGSIDVAGARGVSYLVDTGKNWAKPIGLAQFRFLIPAQAHEIRLRPNQENGKNGREKRSVKYILHQGKPMIELVYDAKNWTPKESHVSINFESPCYANDRIFPPTWNPKTRAKKLGRPARFCLWEDLKLAYTDKKEAVERLSVSSSHLDTCIKAVRAMRGGAFSDKYDHSYFYANVPASKQAPAPTFRPNASFSPAFLGPRDNEAIERLERAKLLATKTASKAMSAPPSPKPQLRHTAPPAKAPAKAARKSWCMLHKRSPSNLSTLVVLILPVWLRKTTRSVRKRRAY